MAPHATPEILNADLTPVALQLLQWGISDPFDLAWLDLDNFSYLAAENHLESAAVERRTNLD